MRHEMVIDFLILELLQKKDYKIDSMLLMLFTLIMLSY
jgi:hypothetical protein